MLDQTIDLQRQNLLSRLALGTKHLEFFRGIVASAFDIAARLDTERDRIARDANLSDAGKRSAVANLVTGDLAPSLARGSARSARRAAEHNASRRAGIGKPKFDASDLVAAHERQEVRSHLRSVPEGERLQAACKLVTNIEAAQAILSGPHALLTGLTEDQFDKVHSIYLARFFSDQVGEVDALQADLDVLTAAVALAVQRLSGASGMTEVQWRDFWTALQGANE